jgi:hypothetical protein
MSLAMWPLAVHSKCPTCENTCQMRAIAWAHPCVTALCKQCVHSCATREPPSACCWQQGPAKQTLQGPTTSPMCFKHDPPLRLELPPAMTCNTCKHSGRACACQAEHTAGEHAGVRGRPCSSSGSTCTQHELPNKGAQKDLRGGCTHCIVQGACCKGQMRICYKSPAPHTHSMKHDPMRQPLPQRLRSTGAHTNVLLALASCNYWACLWLGCVG